MNNSGVFAQVNTGFFFLMFGHLTSRVLLSSLHGHILSNITYLGNKNSEHIRNLHPTNELQGVHQLSYIQVYGGM